jgi:hypothetical protein
MRPSSIVAGVPLDNDSPLTLAIGVRRGLAEVLDPFMHDAAERLEAH